MAGGGDDWGESLTQEHNVTTQVQNLASNPLMIKLQNQFQEAVISTDVTGLQSIGVAFVILVFVDKRMLQRPSASRWLKQK